MLECEPPSYLHRRAPTSASGGITVLLWSGGKDSFLALRALLRAGRPAAQQVEVPATPEGAAQRRRKRRRADLPEVMPMVTREEAMRRRADREYAELKASEREAL